MIDVNTQKEKNGSILSRFLVVSLIALGVLISGLPAQAERTTTYYAVDALGSPIVAMDEQGDVIWRKSYLPYGKQRNVDPGDKEETAYTGKQLDRDTGLIYFGARWYDPDAGRFTGVDPVGFMDSNPQSFNRYAYVNNNPYRFIDPDGRQATTRADYADLLSPNDPSTKIAERAAQIGENAAAVGDAVDDIVSDPTTYVGGGSLKAATLVGKAVKGTKWLKPEAKYLRGKKHGVKWTEGPATARKTGIPQGQWGSKADLDFAGKKASTLEAGKGDWFDLPKGHTSVVHRPDGTTVPANRIWVRNNGSGTFHGYPAE